MKTETNPQAILDNWMISTISKRYSNFIQFAFRVCFFSNSLSFCFFSSFSSHFLLFVCSQYSTLTHVRKSLAILNYPIPYYALRFQVLAWNSHKHSKQWSHLWFFFTFFFFFSVHRLNIYIRSTSWDNFRFCLAHIYINITMHELLFKTKTTMMTSNRRKMKKRMIILTFVKNFDSKFHWEKLTRKQSTDIIFIFFFFSHSFVMSLLWVGLESLTHHIIHIAIPIRGKNYRNRSDTFNNLTSTVFRIFCYDGLM